MLKNVCTQTLNIFLQTTTPQYFVNVKFSYQTIIRFLKIKLLKQKQTQKQTACISLKQQQHKFQSYTKPQYLKLFTLQLKFSSSSSPPPPTNQIMQPFEKQTLQDIHQHLTKRNKSNSSWIIVNLEKPCKYYNIKIIYIYIPNQNSHNNPNSTTYLIAIELQFKITFWSFNYFYLDRVFLIEHKANKPTPLSQRPYPTTQTCGSAFSFFFGSSFRSSAVYQVFVPSPYRYP
eukprot:TRINITY_DN25765_c0_g1_i1.p2 TRINITY_DN25765_c0_g1~~TRINITY_DN25765_c0_g1_i1.p2  ORF type:complete len:231 (+),score=-10.94 TRINITY_DN25765_c0_g1_i1:433-1125(+)